MSYELPERNVVTFDQYKDISYSNIYWTNVINDTMGLSNNYNLYLNWGYAACLAVI